jgi:hypothetical protein
MKTSWLRIFASGFFALLTAAHAQAATLPPVLEAVVKDGAIPAGSWEWMRGAMSDASPEQKRDWAAVETWLTKCAEDDRVTVLNELKLLGITKTALAERIVTSQTCVQAGSLKSALSPSVTWPEFDTRMREAKRVLDYYLFGARVANAAVQFDPAQTKNRGEEILRAAAQEQVLRKAFSWNARSDAPQLDDWLMPYFRSQLAAVIIMEDRANTNMLKSIIAEHGWPGWTGSGERVSKTAWLLAQHADHDPAFQLRVLRLMEPMVAAREVRQADYAYLYDRVMLKITGLQRFGTQFGECKSGLRQLRPLEPKRDLAADRAAMGLTPMEEYRAAMDSMAGPCPK